MDAKSLNASIAYLNSLKQAAQLPAGAAGAAAPEAGGSDFAALLQDAAKDLTQASERAESMSVQAAAQEANLIDVMSAVTNAEIALESVVAVRDKVVQAYTDILRMPI